MRTAILILLMVFVVATDGTGDAWADQGEDAPAAVKAVSHIYGGGLRPIVEDSADGQQTLNVYGPGNQIIAQVVLDADGSTQEVRHLLTDHAGSTRVVLNQQVKTVAAFDYSPYGETVTHGDEAGALAYRYTGQRSDDVLDSYHYPAREYDPGLGRFLEVDPARSGTSSYVHAADNPINLVDPTGGEDVHFIFIDYDGFKEISRVALQLGVRRNLRLSDEDMVWVLDIRAFTHVVTQIPKSGDKRRVGKTILEFEAKEFLNENPGVRLNTTFVLGPGSGLPTAEFFQTLNRPESRSFQHDIYKRLNILSYCDCAPTVAAYRANLYEFSQTSKRVKRAALLTGDYPKLLEFAREEETRQTRLAESLAKPKAPGEAPRKRVSFHPNTEYVEPSSHPVGHSDSGGGASAGPRVQVSQGTADRRTAELAENLHGLTVHERLPKRPP